MPDTVWVTGCDSWYLGPDGTPTLWPFTPEQFYEMLGDLPEEEFTASRERERRDSNPRPPA